MGLYSKILFRMPSSLKPPSDLYYQLWSALHFLSPPNHYPPNSPLHYLHCPFWSPLHDQRYIVNASNRGTLSEQLISMKEDSMAILKEYRTKHNVPNDVPDELIEEASEDDDETAEKPQVKAKKTKLFMDQTLKF
ncbi:unnamed protein product [Citrullus colocynthis]|uniref:Uncharacterized protein n=1 Tax=Citrullus colocynthis TaxID=252529 RepID=A0ABP0ZBQ9_9ROSI